MDFTWSAKAEQMRHDVAEFLAVHLPPELEATMCETGVMHDDGFVRALAERDWIVPGRDPNGAGAEPGSSTGPTARTNRARPRARES